MDFQRLNGASRTNIKEFFDRLAHEDIARIPPEHTWNFDEIGAQIGLGYCPFVIGPAAINQIFAMDTPRGEWTTSLEAISAAGRALPPLVIFKGKAVQQQWFSSLVDEQDFESWSFKASQAGWTSNSIALRWLKQIFVPLTAPEDPKQWRHLILDGHVSHCTEEFMMTCFEARVWLNVLPAHTSQVLQPLDLGPFSVLKRAYRKYLRDACLTSLTLTLKKPEFLEAWNKARKEALTPEHIATGWRATGIYPREPSKPLNSRLARQHDRDRPEGATWCVPQPRDDPLLSQMSALDIETPRTSSQISVIHRDLGCVNPVYNNATLRRVFRKAGKALDQATAEISSLKHERDQLAAALDHQKPQKRRKVQLTAQDLFVTMLEVCKVKEEMSTPEDAGGTVTVESEAVHTDGSDEEVDSEAEDCIVVS